MISSTQIKHITRRALFIYSRYQLNKTMQAVNICLISSSTAIFETAKRNKSVNINYVDSHFCWLK